MFNAIVFNFPGPKTFQLPTSKVFKDEQLMNVASNSIRLGVFQLETSKEDKEEQPENIDPILITLEVSQLERFKEDKEGYLVKEIN